MPIKYGEYVIPVWSGEAIRNMELACTYCGSLSSKCRDHVVSIAWKGYGRCYNKGDTVAACSECNGLLGSIALFSIYDRAAYLEDKLNCKYSKILNIPEWSDDELAELDKNLRRKIKATIQLKNIVALRIEHCHLMAYPEHEEEGISNLYDEDE